ncbi:hypothetical protein ACIA49_07715 [Kribbella sp. NPDC051587]|uniref:hypothetical protein n=1 Tax=Kribbella sp. NPDC051587 TaxID=3364119 RepID=UPI0037939552
MDDTTRTTAMAALAKLWSEGCPLADPGSHATVLDVAWRRWRSFDRRNKRKHPDRDDRIEDTAKGLCSAMEPDPTLTGPLMQHYHCLSVALASAFDPI